MMIPFPVLMVSMFSIWRWLGDHTGMQFLGHLPARSGFRRGSDRRSTSSCSASSSSPSPTNSPRRRHRRLLGVGNLLPHHPAAGSRPRWRSWRLFAFMGVWNDFLGPLIYIQDPQNYTLALGIGSYQSQQGGTPWNLVMAASTLSSRRLSSCSSWCRRRSSRASRPRA